MAKKVDVKNISDSVPNILDVINKKFKGVPNSFSFLSDANLVDTWVSTGSSVLDLAISNRTNSGVPFGTFLEIYGGSASAKSLLAAHILTNTQKMGGLAVLFDTEKAVGMLDFYKSIGMDTDTLVYSDKMRELDFIFDSIEMIITESYNIDPSRPITIVIDSIMGATTSKEAEADYGKEGWATDKAIILSKAMRKLTSLLVNRKILIVFINQVRTNLGVTFGETDTTSGGKAIMFHSSIRLKTKAVKKLVLPVNGIDIQVGQKIQVTVVKSRFGPPGRAVTFNVMFDSGIDDVGSWLDIMKEMGFLKISGSWYSYEYVDMETGELITKKFQSKDFKKMLSDNASLRDSIYNEISKTMIMEYKLDEFGIDDFKEADATEADNE